MKNLKKIALITMMGLSIAITACQEDVEIEEGPVVKQPYKEGPDELQNPKDKFPYPAISKQSFVPENKQWVDTKSLAWRIEWPEYDASVNLEMIPTFFGSVKGNLNSLNYLLNDSAKIKSSLNFSLFADQQLVSATEVNAQWPALEDISTGVTYFGKIKMPLSTIEHWVKERPDQFENYWPYVKSIETALIYQEGDFFLYYQPEEHHFGGIRIVSMNPRIIEVYKAVPNI